MLDWRKCSDVLPTENNADCLLFRKDAEIAFGPVGWNEQSGTWIDLFGPFASKEAGSVFKPDTMKDGPISHWTPYSSPEGFDDE